MTIRIKIVAIFIFLFVTINVNAQWEVSAGAAPAFPITGYNEVFGNGWLVSAAAKYRLNNRHLSIGAETEFARLQKDRESSDAFQNARMTIVPLIFFAEYETNPGGLIRPFVTAGLGISFFNINYDTSPTEGTTINNVSFTMSPQAGLRYGLSKTMTPFVKAGAVLIADGPPVGFPQGDKLTGYGSIEVGLTVTLNK
jgi:hypothetical protein